MRYALDLTTLAASALLLALSLIAGVTAAQAHNPLDGLPDLVVDGITMDRTGGTDCVPPGPTFGSTVWVRNDGAGDAGPFVVDLNGHQQTVESGLPAGQTAHVSFDDFSNYSHIVVDSTFLVAESNEDNNTADWVIPTSTPPPPCTPSPTPSPTPLATPDPPLAVGGAAELPPYDQSGNGGTDTGLIIIACAGFVAVLATGGVYAGWRYSVRRR